MGSLSSGEVRGTVHLQSNTPFMKSILESHFSATAKKARLEESIALGFSGSCEVHEAL